MAEGSSLINLGEISKPATVLIEKISEAVGGIARPWQIRRIAKAETQAEIIRAEAKLQISEIERRGLERLIVEEGKKQKNIEEITMLAIPGIREDARPNEVENDWLAHFFDRCRLISDTEMQTMWARILASEANMPGSFSKRTIDLASTLDKSDAQLFTTLCQFCWTVKRLTPIIIESNVAYGDLNNLFARASIDFDALVHLDALGLIKYDHTGFAEIGMPKRFEVSYFGRRVSLEFPKTKDNFVGLGVALFTRAGSELAQISGAKEADSVFFEHVLAAWRKQGCTTVLL